MLGAFQEVPQHEESPQDHRQGNTMSDLHDLLEEARLERALLERRPSEQTGFMDVADEYAEQEPEDQELQETE